MTKKVKRIVGIAPNANIVEVTNIGGLDSICFVKMSNGEIYVEHTGFWGYLHEFIAEFAGNGKFAPYTKELEALVSMIMARFEVNAKDLPVINSYSIGIFWNDPNVKTIRGVVFYPGAICGNMFVERIYPYSLIEKALESSNGDLDDMSDYLYAHAISADTCIGEVEYADILNKLKTSDDYISFEDTESALKWMISCVNS
jgi:hypothetical protein